MQALPADFSAFMAPSQPGRGGLGASTAIAPLPDGRFPAIPPEWAAMLALQQQMQAAPEPIVSELDRWAMKNHGVRATELDDEGMNGLIAHIRALAKIDREYWQPRNDRIAREQDYYELKRPDLGAISGSEAGKSAEDEANNVEILISPIPRLVVDKLTAMLASADWPIEVPARTVDGTAASQKVENLLAWFQRQLTRRFAREQQESLGRKLAFSGVLTGWMCALLLPDPENPRFPFLFRLEDPSLVYPRFTDRGTVRVTRQFMTEALEARAEYPELEDMLADYQDDDLVTIIGYYDEIYRIIIVEGMDARSADAMAVMRPVRHGCQTLEGKPLCPWIIHLPNGKGFQTSRRAFTGVTGGTASVSSGGSASMGTGALYAMWDTYDQINRIASQLATNVARSENPPMVQYLQPNEEPKQISFAPGARNYLVFQRNQLDILETTPNGGDLQPLMGLLQDWLAKSTLPGVYWGESGGATSGFMTNILANAAKHVLLAYVQGMIAFQAQLYERALECLMAAFRQGWIQELSITQRVDQGRLVGGAVITAQDLLAVEPDIEVEFMDLTAQDIAGAVQTELMATQGGIHAVETAMKKTGIQDVELEQARIDLRTLLADPVIAAQMGPLMLSNPGMSTQERLVMAQQIKMQLLQQQQAMEAAQAGGGGSIPATKPGVSTSTLPSEMGGPRAGMAPGREDPLQQQQRAGNRVIANLSAGRGGSPPAPQQ